MNGARIGEGFGCLAVFAIIGFVAALVLLVLGLIWCYNHIKVI